MFPAQKTYKWGCRVGVAMLSLSERQARNLIGWVLDGRWKEQQRAVESDGLWQPFGLAITESSDQSSNWGPHVIHVAQLLDTQRPGSPGPRRRLCHRPSFVVRSPLQPEQGWPVQGWPIRHRQARLLVLAHANRPIPRRNPLSIRRNSFGNQRFEGYPHAGGLQGPSVTIRPTRPGRA